MIASGSEAVRAFDGLRQRRSERRHAIGPHNDGLHPHLSATHGPWQDGVSIWTPAKLSNMVVWFEADQGVTTASNAVSAWADQSGNAYNLTQSTSANQPTLVANSVNGLPSIHVNGSQYLATPALAALNGASQVTVFAVLFGSVSPLGVVYEHSTNYNTQAGSFALFVNDVAANNVEFARNIGSSIKTDDYFVPSSSTFASPGQINVIYDATSTIGGTRIVARYNRASQALTYFSGATTGTFLSYPLFIGARSGNIGGWTGNYCEIAICAGASSNSDIIAFESYAKSKWGLP